MKLSYMIATPEVTATPMSWVGDADTVIKRVAAIGYRGVELQVRDPQAFDRDEFRRTVAGAGLAITGVSNAPAVTEDGLYFTSPDQSVRQATVARMHSNLEFAAECGTHATIGRMRGFARWAETRAAGIGYLRAALDELVPRAEKLGVRIVLEPQATQSTDMFNTIAETLDFADEYGSDVLAIEADSYHMASEERSLPAALVTAHRSGRLIHVQISDTNRLAPGRGHLNWADFFATLTALDYPGWICIEALQQRDSETVATESFDFVRLMWT